MCARCVLTDRLVHGMPKWAFCLCACVACVWVHISMDDISHTSPFSVWLCFFEVGATLRYTGRGREGERDARAVFVCVVLRSLFGRCCTLYTTVRMMFFLQILAHDTYGLFTSFARMLKRCICVRRRCYFNRSPFGFTLTLFGYVSPI